MARGEYRQAAVEYTALADSSDLLTSTGLKMPEQLRSLVWACVVTALELAEDDPALRTFLGRWVVVLMGVVSVVYGYRVGVEERALLVTIGDPYRRYMSRTNRFVPFLF